MPERSNIVGEPYAPPLKIISLSAFTSNDDPFFMQETERATKFLKLTLSTVVSVRIERFFLFFASVKKATAALHLLPFF